MDRSMPAPNLRILPLCLLVASILAASPLMCISPASAADSKSLIKALEENPSMLQWEKLKADLPVRDIFIETQNLIWLVSKTTLWRWDLDAKVIKRIILLQKSQADKDELLSIASNGSELFIAAQSGAFGISFDPFKVVHYHLPGGAKTKKDSESKPGHSWGIIGSAKRLFLVRENGALEIDQASQTLKPALSGVQIAEADQLLYSERDDVFWLSKERSLIRLQKKDEADEGSSGSAYDQVTTFKANHPIIDLKSDGSSLYAHTRYAVIKLSRAGQALQSIPVEGERRLARMTMAPGVHAYLFSDKLFEIYHLDGKNLDQYYIDLGAVRSAGEVSLNKDTLALVADGRPRVFRLPRRIEP